MVHVSSVTPAVLATSVQAAAAVPVRDEQQAESPAHPVAEEPAPPPWQAANSPLVTMESTKTSDVTFGEFISEPSCPQLERMWEMKRVASSSHAGWPPSTDTF